MPQQGFSTSCPTTACPNSSPATLTLQRLAHGVRTLQLISAQTQQRQAYAAGQQQVLRLVHWLGSRCPRLILRLQEKRQQKDVHIEHSRLRPGKAAAKRRIPGKLLAHARCCYVVGPMLLSPAVAITQDSENYTQPTQCMLPFAHVHGLCHIAPGRRAVPGACPVAAAAAARLLLLLLLCMAAMAVPC